jgi:integrase
VLLYATGVRIGEALALRWCDLDLDCATAEVTASMVEAKSHPYERGPTKTGESRMTHQSASVVDALRAHQRSRVADPRSEDFVFTSGRGTPERLSNLRTRWWRPLRKRAGLDVCGFHRARHTFDTIALRTCPVKSVQAALGHATATQRLNTYGHLLPGDEHLAIGAVEAAITQGGNSNGNGSRS